MPRNYTQLTIKTLFGEARCCAYPGCNEPLIFRDRGRSTPVADIAHIRSETPNGPRHDPQYAGDVNGPENLILLCGTHHRPVDRHESVYTIDELAAWKDAQRATAGAGTAISESDVRAYARLTEDERGVLIDIARLSQRLVSAVKATDSAVNAVDNQSEQARKRAVRSAGPIYETRDDGTMVNITDQLQLSYAEQREWLQKADEARKAHIPKALEALDDLYAEMSVLDMIAPSLMTALGHLRAAAEVVVDTVDHGWDLAGPIADLERWKVQLWRTANGEADESTDQAIWT